MNIEQWTMKNEHYLPALIRNPVLHRIAIAYWPDHAAREVRVARIEANRGN